MAGPNMREPRRHPGNVRETREDVERRFMARMGGRLRSLREERNLTQDAVARAAGITTDMISRLENGRYKSPGLRTLLRIAEGMGIAVRQLLPDTPASTFGTQEHGLRARLMTTAHRASREDLELIVELAATVVERRERGRG
ncbi:MAG: helix-turn-helix domain-containing protein [Nannocystaceae bacterium]